MQFDPQEAEVLAAKNRAWVANGNLGSASKRIMEQNDVMLRAAVERVRELEDGVIKALEQRDAAEKVVEAARRVNEMEHSGSELWGRVNTLAQALREYDDAR